MRVQIAPFLEIKRLVNSLTFIYNSNIKSRKNNETQINPNKSWEAETNEVRINSIMKHSQETFKNNCLE